jgi:dihydrofolate reductase
MRRIVVFDRMTADGYFAGSDGNLDWVVPDEEVDQEATKSIPRSDTMLFGRRTYEMFEGFWPRALEDPSGASDPHGEGRRNPSIQAMARWINDSEKVVFSRTRKDATWKNSRVVHDFDPHEIESMKRQPGKDILVFGSGSIASELARHDLVDEFQFIVSPVLLGNGRTLLHDVPNTTRLELVESKAYPSGNVVLRYQRPH